MSGPRGIELDGELALEREGSPAARVRAGGRRLLVLLDDVRSARTLEGQLPRGPLRPAVLESLRAVLARTGLRVEVRLRGRPIAHLSGSTRGSWLARRLGLPGVDLSLKQLLLASLSPARVG